ncbi:hypothetical protein ACFV2I_21280, partial [Streptomyces microflavus]
MTRKARSMKWTALALATAVVIAPVAYSGGKLPTFNKVPAAKAAASPKAAKLASAKLTQPTTTNRFIITRAPGAAAKVSAAAMNQQYAKAAATLGIGIKPLRTLATGSQLI